MWAEIDPMRTFLVTHGQLQANVDHTLPMMTKFGTNSINWTESSQSCADIDKALAEVDQNWADYGPNSPKSTDLLADFDQIWAELGPMLAELGSTSACSGLGFVHVWTDLEQPQAHPG